MTRGVGTLLLFAQVWLQLPGCSSPARVPRPGAAGSQGWLLLSPPEVPDAGFPHGIRLQPSAPLSEWQQVAPFETEEACQASRTARANDAIDRARAAYGDDAKFDLPVRRAVNARCVPGESAAR